MPYDSKDKYYYPPELLLKRSTKKLLTVEFLQHQWKYGSSQGNYSTNTPWIVFKEHYWMSIQYSGMELNYPPMLSHQYIGQPVKVYLTFDKEGGVHLTDLGEAKVTAKHFSYENYWESVDTLFAFVEAKHINKLPLMICKMLAKAYEIGNAHILESLKTEKKTEKTT